MASHQSDERGCNMYYKQFINFVPGCPGNLPIVVFQFLVCGTKFLILPLRGHDTYKTYPIFTPFLTRPRAPKEDKVEGRHLSWCFLPLHTIQDHLSSVLFVQEQPKKTARWPYFPHLWGALLWSYQAPPSPWGFFDRDDFWWEGYPMFY